MAEPCDTGRRGRDSQAAEVEALTLRIAELLVAWNSHGDLGSRIFVRVLSAQRESTSNGSRLGVVAGAAVAAYMLLLLAAPGDAFAGVGSISGHMTQAGAEIPALPGGLVCALRSEKEERVQGENCELSHLPDGAFRSRVSPPATTKSSSGLAMAVSTGSGSTTTTPASGLRRHGSKSPTARSPASTASWRKVATSAAA